MFLFHHKHSHYTFNFVKLLRIGFWTASLILLQPLVASEKIDDWQLAKNEQKPKIQNNNNNNRFNNNPYTKHPTASSIVEFEYYPFILVILSILLIIFGVGLILIHRNVRLKIPIITSVCKSSTNAISKNINKHKISNEIEIGNDVSNKKYYSNATLKRVLQISCGITSGIMFFIICLVVIQPLNNQPLMATTSGHSFSTASSLQFSAQTNSIRSRAMPMKKMSRMSGVSDAMVMNMESAAVASDRTIGLSVGGAKAINNFRQNIKNGYLPQKSDVTIEGIFYDYYFDTGENKDSNGNANITPCNYLFCPSYSQGMWFCFSIACYTSCHMLQNIPKKNIRCITESIVII